MRNKHLYPISAMCRILGLSRQSDHYQSKPKKDESELEEVVAEDFIAARKAYGSRKIKKALSKRGIQISRRKISRIMKNRGLNRAILLLILKYIILLAMKPKRQTY